MIFNDFAPLTKKQYVKSELVSKKGKTLKIVSLVALVVMLVLILNSIIYTVGRYNDFNKIDTNQSGKNFISDLENAWGIDFGFTTEEYQIFALFEKEAGISLGELIKITLLCVVVVSVISSTVLSVLAFITVCNSQYKCAWATLIAGVFLSTSLFLMIPIAVIFFCEHYINKEYKSYLTQFEKDSENNYKEPDFSV